MRSTNYATIERGVASIAGIEPDNILAHEKTILADYITDATKFCWDYYPWGECTVTEKRYFKDVWSTGNTYNVNEEVYYDGSFYRNHSGSNSDPSTLVDWYEIGDNIAESEWQEDGLYSIGARVGYNGKSYACIAVPSLGRTNFLTDGIEVTDTNYFIEIDPFFERYIDYEQTGKNVIENCIGIYTSDPRYTNAKHLNFREGREGIYIEAIDGIINEFWMIYKIAPPIFTSTQTTGDIPRFLTQAIKAHAYQSFLIGEGQHEKAQLQELKILDLLVRETDKIDLQANKNKPYSIQHSSHRIINSRQGQVTDLTPDLINKMHETGSNLTFKLSTLASGTGSFRMSRNIGIHFKITGNFRAGQTKQRNANISFVVTASGTANKARLRVVSNISADLKIQAQTSSYRIRFASLTSVLSIRCYRVAGGIVVGKEGEGSASFSIKTSNTVKGAIGAVVKDYKDANGSNVFATDLPRSGSANSELTTSPIHEDNSAQNIFNHRNNNSRFIDAKFGMSYIATANNSAPSGLGWRNFTVAEFLSTDFGQGKGNTLVNSEHLSVLGDTIFVYAPYVALNNGTTYFPDGSGQIYLEPTQLDGNTVITDRITFAYYTDFNSHSLPSSTNFRTLMLINTINLNDGSIGGSPEIGNSTEHSNIIASWQSSSESMYLLQTSLRVFTESTTWSMAYNQLNNGKIETVNVSNVSYSDASVGRVPYIIPSAVDQTLFPQADQTNGIATEIDGGDKSPNTQLLNRSLSASDYKV